MERWIAVGGFPDYEVSDFGNVRRKTAKRGTVAGKVLKPSRDANGYAVVNLYTPQGRAKKQYVHRLVATAFLPKPPGSTQVAHWDGDGMNARLSNLRWVSQSENEEDKRRHGRDFYVARGSRSFTPEQVAAFRAMAQAGMSVRKIAREAGSTHNTVAHAIRFGSAIGAPPVRASNHSSESGQG